MTFSQGISDGHWDPLWPAIWTPQYLNGSTPPPSQRPPLPKPDPVSESNQTVPELLRELAKRIMMRFPHCTTGKRRYKLEATAREALATTNSTGARNRAVYRCKWCGDWHLTSRPPTNETTK